MGKHRFPEGKALLCRMVCIDTKKKRTLLAESLLYSCFSVLAWDQKGRSSVESLLRNSGAAVGAGGGVGMS